MDDKHIQPKTAMIPRRRFGSLFLRLSAGLAAFAIAPMAIFFAGAYRSMEKAEISSSGAGLYSLCSARANEISLYFKDRMKTVEILSVLRPLTDFLESKTDRIQFAESFEKLFDKTDFKECFVFAKDGTLMYSTKFASGIKNVSDEILEGTQVLETYKRVMESGKTVISPLSTNPLDGEPSVFIATAAYSGETFMGVCIFSVDMFRISQILSADSSGAQRFVCVYQKNIPYVLTESEDTFELVSRAPLTLKNSAPFANAELSSPSEGVRAFSPDGEPLIAAWEYIPMLRWYVFSVDSPANAVGFMKKYQRQLILFSIVLLPVCVFFAKMISRAILAPVKRLIVRSEKMLCGDFSDTAAVRASMEFKILADNFAAIRNMTVSFMDRSSRKTREVSGNLSDILDRTRDRTRMLKNAGEAVESMAQKSSGISDNSAMLKENLSAVLAASEETVVNAEGGLVHIEKIESSMKDLNAFSTELTSQLRGLYGSAEVIERVVETMENVADKTNLLSLNAAIESKKAGDFGKGFSVVAAEIGSLATQTANSTVEIEKGISAMIASVNAGIAGMNTFAKKVDSSYEDMMVVSAHLTGIIQQVQGLPMRLDAALEAVAGQSSSSSEICARMESLRADISKIMDSVEQTEKIAAETLAQIRRKDGSGIL